jgi:dynein heavy chain
LNGLQKLDETNANIVKMRDDLESMGPKLQEKTQDTEELMVQLEIEQEKVNAVKAVVTAEQEVTDAEAQRVEAIATEAQQDLDTALPQLEAANQALDALNKNDIGEIRSYANPPTMVMTVMSAVCVLLNEKPDWSTSKLLLGDPSFMKILINYDKNSVTDKIYKRLQRYTKQTDFNPTSVGRISIACKSMCSWVLALEHILLHAIDIRPTDVGLKSVCFVYL